MHTSSTDEATAMDHDHPSGDSDTSASTSARIALSVIIPPVVTGWVAPRPERPFDQYTLREVHAAAGLALVLPRTVNPAYDSEVFICDP
jgi:hypothetical protein